MNRNYTPKKNAREWNKAREEMQKKYDCWNCRHMDYCNPLTGCKKEKFNQEREISEDEVSILDSY